MTLCHGGDIYHNKVSLDFSVNLNPLGCPEEVRLAMAEAAGRAGVYPDPEQAAARQAIAEWLGIGAGQLICAGGASEIFSILIHMLKPSCVLLLSPCFGGYERACQNSAGCRIKRHMLREEEAFVPGEDLLEELTEEVDLCFLCDPNNPTGQPVPEALMEKILRRCREKGIKLVADECFIELSDEGRSLIPRVSEYEGLYVVRAFTKLLAVPGVRLGYLVSCEENIRRFSAFLPEWDLSVFAEAAAISGACVLKRGDYLKETLKLLAEERAYLTAELEALGIRTFPGSANFLLLDSAAGLYGKLLEREILIRDCSDFFGPGKGRYRIAVKKHEENVMLINALKEVL